MRSQLKRFSAPVFVTALLAVGALSGCMESSTSTETGLAVATVTGVAPTITVQPENTAITIGNRFAIGVTATGSATLQYAWQKCDEGVCVNIPSANGPTFSRISRYLDTSTYRCKVSNAFGSVNSRAAYNEAQTIPIQAETGILTGAVIASSVPGFTGAGYILFPSINGGNVVIKPALGNAGTYNLSIYYSSISPHSLKVEVNGAVVNAALPLPVTGNYSSYSRVSLNVPLKAGTNTIKMTTIGFGGPQIDMFRIL